MARLVSVILSANADPYVAELLKAERSNQKFEKSTQKSSQTIEAAFRSQGQAAQRSNQRLIASLRAEEAEMEKAAAAAKRYGKATSYLTKHKDQLNTLAGGMAKFGVAAGVAFGAAVKSAADFDEAMSEVQAAQGGSAENMVALRKAAIEWGQKTKYSATEAADGITQLIKAGVSAKDVLGGGLQGALNLAAAGQISVADAAEDAASAMNQFGLQGKDVPHIADLLAAAAGKAQGEVSDMAVALKYVGPVAAQMGVSIEETSGTIAELASNGILADQAGTSLRGMLSSLTSPSAKAANTMKDLGINVYDAKGNFVGFNGIAGQLQKGLNGLSNAQRDQALGVIFGNEQITAARILYSGGAAAVNKWTKSVNDSGFAARTAATKMDNLKGDIEQLKGAFETALIGAGEGQQGPLRELVQQLTDLINKWNELSDGTKSAVTRIVGSLAAVAFAGAGLIKIATTAATVKTALIDLGIAGKKAGTEVAAGAEVGSAGMSRMRKSAGLAAAAFVALQIAGQVANSIQGDLNPSLEQTNTLLDQLANKAPTAAKNINSYFSFDPLGGSGSIKSIGDALDAMDGWDAKVGDVIDGLVGLQSPLDGAKSRFDALDDSLASMVQNGSMDAAQKSFAQLVKQAQAQGHSVDELLPKFDTYRQALESQAATLGVTTLKDKDYVAWMGGKVPEAVQKASTAAIANKKATDDQKTAAQQASPAAQELANANGQLQQSYEDLNKATDAAIKNFSILKQGAIDQETANEEWGNALASLSKDASGAVTAQAKLAEAQGRVRAAEQRLAELRKSGTASASSITRAENSLKSARDAVAAASDKAAKANAADSRSLSLHTQAGRDNRAAIKDAVSAMNDKIAADFKAESQTKSVAKATDDASKKLQQQKKDLVDTAVKAGYNRAEVKKMVDQMVLTPKELRTQVEAYGIDDLKKKIQDLQRQIDRLTGTHEVDINYRVTAGGAEVHFSGKDASLNYATAKASGGFVSGPGGPTEDKIPARLSNGEYVIKASSVSKLGRKRLDYMNWTGQIPAFREGGLVNHGGLNTGANGARGSASVTPINVDGSIAAGAVQEVVSAVAATSKSIQNAVGDFIKGAMSGGGVRLGGDNVVSWHGGRFTDNFAKHLQLVYDQQPFQVYQGGFRPTTSYSGSTHNKDAVDVGTAYDKLALLMRQQGIAAWHRTPSQGPWVAHTHGVPGPNVGLASPSAAAQYRDYLHGGNGLGGKDDGPRVGVISGGAGDVPNGSPRQVFKSLMLAAGYSPSDWFMVDYIISHESSWNVHARNPSSGAYGLPQALPGSKMGAYGKNWRDDPAVQGAFFFDYINRYGGLRGAYNFWRTNHWYATGGPVSGPGTGTSDDIPAWLSNGEYVINAKSTQKHRLLLDMINADKFATGGVVGYGSSSKFDVSAIVRMITSINDPIKDLANATRGMRKIVDKYGMNLAQASAAYNRARTSQSNLRLSNARQTEQARTRVANASAQVKAAELALDKMEPKSEKIRKAQSALISAQKSLDSKRRSAAESIAKIEDKIRSTKKGTTQYQNLLTEKSLKQKANARAIADAEDKVAKARKTADKAGVNTDRIAAAQRRLARAENELTKAREHQSKVSRENSLQTAQASKRVSDAKARVDALKASNDALIQSQQAVADSARQVSDAFSETYLSKSTAVNDWLQAMSLGTKDIAGLNSRIKKLRSLGLSETLIQQIIGIGQNAGAPSADTIADQIISGGKKTVDQLNKATKGLQSAADKLGYAAATGAGRYAVGGMVSGAGTGTSDSITARLSNGEYVVNAAATARNRRVLDAINYGGRQYAHYASGGMVSGGISKQELIAAVAAIVDSRPVFEGNQFGYDPRQVGQALDASRNRKLVRAGIGVRR